MGSERVDWSEDETLFLFKVFLTEPQSNLRLDSPFIGRLTEVLPRKREAIHHKLEDIRSNNPGYIASGRKPKKCANMVKEIWASLMEDDATTLRRMDDVYREYGEKGTITETVVLDDINPGLDVPSECTRRVGQQVFRRTVATNYDLRCCITGISTPELLVASHIKPWKESDPEEKTSPYNGLYLNRLHDGLFDKHLMTLDEDLRIVYSDEVRENNDEDVFERFFGKSENARIRMPSKYDIDENLIAYHRERAYAKWSYGKT